jgi:putative redox protein
MRSAIARRKNGFEHEVAIREHSLTVDEPEDRGGTDTGPSPGELLAAALATCSAITIEMYADRKGWELGDVEVDVEMEYGRSGSPQSFAVTLHLPRALSEDQSERLREIAGKCPVHRALSGEREVTITDRVELG